MRRGDGGGAEGQAGTANTGGGGGGGNNIIVVPQSGNKRGSGVNNIPTRTGGVDLSLLPFEPLNIGDDILLHKLNQ